MDKQTLEEIRTIICNEYLDKKDQILKDEISGKIDSGRALDQRMKLIGMMTAVEIIQGEIKKNNYRYYIDTKNKKGKDIEITLSEIEIDNIMYEYNKIIESDNKILDEIL